MSETTSTRTLTCRIWLREEPPGRPPHAEYLDVWSVSSGKSGKLYVDQGPSVNVTIYEPEAWSRYEIVKTEVVERSEVA